MRRRDLFRGAGAVALLRRGAAADIGDHAAAARKLIDAALADRGGWAKLEYLCDRIGPRLSGSAALGQAIGWCAETMRREGLENVATPPVLVPAWVRGAESAWLLEPRQARLAMLGLGGSVATPPEDCGGGRLRGQLRGAGAARRREGPRKDRRLQPALARLSGNGRLPQRRRIAGGPPGRSRRARSQRHAGQPAHAAHRRAELLARCAPDPRRRHLGRGRDDDPPPPGCRRARGHQAADGGPDASRRPRPTSSAKSPAASARKRWW